MSVSRKLVGAWCLERKRAIRGFPLGKREGWRNLAPGVERRPGAREPCAEAHVETARRFLAALGAAPVRTGLRGARRHAAEAH